MIETPDSKNLYYATMYNFSGDGIYCGSNLALKPGTAIKIRLESRPYNSDPRIYLGEVRRCEKLESDDNSHLYGLGIAVKKAIY
jgi:hypothetical protein